MSAVNAKRRQLIRNGDIKTIKGKKRVYFDNYWIRYYPAPDENLANHKALIDHLTRRAFHHTESGINTPGQRLEKARDAYERETDPARKRVNAAMLAGALFNRATDIFTTVVDLGEKNVLISRQNELMKLCGDCFQEALELGAQVKHYSGEEGIDELWGEPFKAFTMPLADFYHQRYIKIAQTMRDIDEICLKMTQTLCQVEPMRNAEKLVKALNQAAKEVAETHKCDDDYLELWPRYVSLREALTNFHPKLQLAGSERDCALANDACRLLTKGNALVGYIADARVPMPKSRDNYFAALREFSQQHLNP